MCPNTGTSVSVEMCVFAVFIGYTMAVSLEQGLATLTFNVQDTNRSSPTFGTLGQVLLLTVPENVNTSYLVTTLVVSDLQRNQTDNIQYSIIDGRSDVFFMNGRDLRVVKPEQLKGQCVLAVTIRAVDNLTGNYNYIHIKVLVEHEGYQFRLPTPLSLTTLEDNSQDVIKSLNKILEFNVSILELMKHEKDIGEADGNRSDMLLTVCQRDTNNSSYANSSWIQTIISKKQLQISSMFKSFMQQPRETNYNVLDTTVISLIVVSAAFFLISCVAIAYVCMLRKSLYHMKENLSEGENDTDTKQLNNTYLDAHLKDNGSISNTGNDTEVSEFHASTTGGEVVPHEEQELSFSFDIETRSIGLGTVFRREHAIDQQMQKMQRLFQELGDESVNNEIVLTSTDQANVGTKLTLASTDQANVGSKPTLTSTDQANAGSKLTLTSTDQANVGSKLTVNETSKTYSEEDQQLSEYIEEMSVTVYL